MKTDGIRLQITARLAGGDRRFRLGQGRHVIGSATDADVRVDDPTVSRQHLSVVVEDTHAEFTDLDSSNGTWHDGQRVPALSLGREPMEIRLGEVRVRIERLDPGEVRLAIPGDAPQPASKAGGPSRATWGEVALARFALSELPELLNVIVAGETVDRLGPRILAALAATIPGSSLTLCRDGAVLAVAGEESNTGGATLNRGTWTLLASGAAEDLERNKPLLTLALQLLELAGGGKPSPEEAAAEPPRTDSAPPDPPTQTPRLRALYEQAARVAGSEIGVLVQGETGTGKELFARYIHANSGLPEDQLIALNCAALPADLLESELFGIDRGVATGVSERAGRFEQADGGTLFLDEIGDMALETQAKILRVLQEKQVYRVGSSKPRAARVRVISATNRDLAAMMDSGEFRRDLYYRLADWTVDLPPLRQRREDLPNLAAHFLATELRRKGKRFGGVSEAAVSVLRAYAWPGNVRELEREMLRCSLFLDSGEPLQSAHLQPRFHEAARSSADGSLKAQLERAEARAIREALGATDGDVESAAQRLDCGKSTLYRRIGQLGIDY